jgi:TolB-like protein/DNA-binding winged helix-turn-helix (wHTH) protein/Tfp pilus assembly protein PilF
MDGMNTQINGFRDEVFALDEIEVNPTSLLIVRPDGSKKIEPKVMQVLLVLASSHGRVVTRQELEDEVWAGRIVTADAVTNAVGKLRKALSDSRKQPRFIETVAKRGYRLIPEPRLLRTHGDEPGAPRSGTGYRLRAALLLVLVAAVLLTWLILQEFFVDRHAPGVAQPPTIAVMPFEDLSPQSEQRYFVDGITHDLITDLSQQPGLQVISSNTTFAYRDTSIDERVIAKELGVRYLVRGAVQRSQEQLRVNARLLEAETGATLWAKRFTGAAATIFLIQDELVSGISRGLQQELAGEYQPFERSGVTQSLEAYDEYLPGREHYGRVTPNDNLIAMQHFSRAIELDPSFARAHAGLALTWSRRAIDGWVEDPEASLRKASRHAETAANIDLDLPQIHFVRGQIALFLGRHQAAAAAANKAVEIAPNYADGYGLLAWIMHYGGRPDLAQQALAKARQLNPASSASYEEIDGEIAFSTGRYEDAVVFFQSALQRNPTHTRARLWLIASLVKLGKIDDANWEAEELITTAPSFSMARMLLAFPHKDPTLRDRLLGAVARVGLKDGRPHTNPTAAKIEEPLYQ